ncbi:hypothetical protein ASF28_01495 [Methylobacterium sp. Leaf99]|uniref:hypothetical protein n=1 Tax=Methylobacterium sp. Leaf99 TaxID=1736251 RepID=UPI0006F48F2A|nr:hypothetical protein [Methylobacterium sp. Leaf99]KQP09882.1 hypothetical protein ASF28_01495 [Methylobacterium sp. Leaf99]
MPPVIHLGLAGLVMLLVAACATAPAAIDPTPPPRRLDAKTQLEYGNPPPPPPPPPGPRY